MKIQRFFLTIVLAIFASNSLLFGSSPAPTPTPPAGFLDCTDVIPVKCGDIISGDTGVNKNNAENYSCNALVENGPEQVLILNLTESAHINARLSSGGFLNIYLLRSCNEHTCIIWGTESFSSDVLVPGVYYIVIDSWISQSYSIQIACASDTPTPTSTPNPDETGPITASCSVKNGIPSIYEGNQTIEINASIDDSSTGNNRISTAEYFVGAPGENGSGHLMSPVDASFDSPAEVVQAIIDTSSWSEVHSPYEIFIHGKDDMNNWGSFCIIEIQVITFPKPGTPVPVPLDSGWLFAMILIFLPLFFYQTPRI